MSAIPRVAPAQLDTATMPTIDARSHSRKDQVRGALRYDPKMLMAADKLTLPLPHDGRVVVYADDDEKAEAVAERLVQQGYHQAAVLEGGIEAYRAAGLPTEEITQEQPVPGEEGAGIPRL